MTTPTILIVDDEVDLCEAIAFDFKRKKFNVRTANSGHEAMKIIDSEKIDIVISDVRMANGDGIELLDWIKARSQPMPVVMFITGFADITLEQAYDKGVDAVFAKPFDRKVLFDVVQRALMPVDARYQRNSARVELDLPIGLKFLKSGFSVGTSICNLGRGGMFVTLQERFPEVTEEVEFKMQTESQPMVNLSGAGIVRWVRKTPAESLPAGCGIEFLNFESNCLPEVTHLINFLKVKSFIPIY
jgi:CheY-like chemotaxis protein/Tfp pilus assembly protein PilZ